ncbi:transcriptional regulator, partial [Xanthomonas vasicola pv. vasculorum NCPPB 206]
TRAAALAGGEPGERIARLHAGMSGTRGGAAAVMQFDASSGQVRFAGLGNIVASLCDGDGVRGMPSHPGIVGAQFRKAQPFDFPHADGKLLVMHSDGLQSRWNLRDHPGLFSRHPRIVAALLLRDYTRGRDDCCVFVMRLGGMQ